MKQNGIDNPKDDYFSKNQLTDSQVSEFMIFYLNNRLINLVFLETGRLIIMVLPWLSAF